MKLLLLLVSSALFIFGCSNQESKEQVKPKLSEAQTVAQGATPYLFTDNNEQVYLSWTESSDGISSLWFSKLKADNTWDDPQQMAKGSDWFVNWADYPVLVTHKGQAMMAHFLAKSSSGTYSYDVNITHSNDSGKNWSDAQVLHDDQMPAEHGFVSMVPYGENYFVSWLDGRNTVAQEGEEHGGPMTVRAAVLNTRGEKLEEWELDHSVCDCCQTTSAITDNGPIVIYRDRSEEEIRDMSIVRWVDNRWTSPQKVNNDHWKIAGCPVNGPRVSAIGNKVAVAWFTAANDQPAVKVKFSDDGGATFGKAIKMDQGKPMGRVDIALIDNEQAIVSWLEGSVIKAALVNKSGEISSRFDIASSSTSRSSGFPQLTKSGNKIIFAWTDDEEQVVNTAILKLN